MRVKKLPVVTYGYLRKCIRRVRLRLPWRVVSFTVGVVAHLGPCRLGRCLGRLLGTLASPLMHLLPARNESETKTISLRAT